MKNELFEDYKGLARENTDHLNSLLLQIEKIDGLETQISWLQDSFEEVNYREEDVTAYFHEWRINLLVIHSLFNYVMKDLKETYKNLKYLNEGTLEELKKIEKADAPTSTNEI